MIFWRQWQLGIIAYYCWIEISGAAVKAYDNVDSLHIEELLLYELMQNLAVLFNFTTRIQEKSGQAIAEAHVF